MPVYVFLCANNKYWVSDVSNIVNYIEWLAQHPPKYIIESACSNNLDDYVILYMRLRGIQNTRGGSYINTILDAKQITHLEQIILNINNKISHTCTIDQCEFELIYTPCKRCGISHDSTTCKQLVSSRGHMIRECLIL